MYFHASVFKPEAQNERYAAASQSTPVVQCAYCAAGSLAICAYAGTHVVTCDSCTFMVSTVRAATLLYPEQLVAFRLALSGNPELAAEFSSYVKPDPASAIVDDALWLRTMRQLKPKVVSDAALIIATVRSYLESGGKFKGPLATDLTFLATATEPQAAEWFEVVGPLCTSC